MTNSIPLIEGPFFDEAFSFGDDDQLLRVARALRDDGYAVIDFPDAEFDAKVEAIRRRLSGQYHWDAWKAGLVEGLRIQDAWRFDDDVKQLALNAQILRLLSQLYGRPAFPFQTLNFPVGTQQHFHSDCVHFSSVPERFMCGVWVAFEDIHRDAGPLIYYPGSHKLPIYLNEHLGITPDNGDDVYASYPRFLELWQQLVRTHRLEPVEFLPKKGQALIWAANLLHGGAGQRDKERTRWSQVTHYYFRGCAYYTPLTSLPFLGSIDYRETVDISSGEPVLQEVNGVPLTQATQQILARKPLKGLEALPSDFDDARYLALHPDVAAQGVDPREHYARYGYREGRSYKSPSQPA